MSSRKKTKPDKLGPRKAHTVPAAGSDSLTPRKRIAFAIIALALPFVLLALLEVGLRIGNYGGSTVLFERPPVFNGRYLAPAEHVAARFFPTEQFPPTPPNDMFLADKPANAVRIFALGESSAAGFPYPPNAMFTRIIADALRDVLPQDTIEVVNLGIAATNSYALVDFTDEILEQKPDAILIYSGHNEFYGALGIGSNESLGSVPGFVRLYLRLQRWKTVRLLRTGISRSLAFATGGSKANALSASRMESVARDQRIELGGRTYAGALRQYESNLAIVLDKFRKAGVPVFIASLASNLRDQRPLASTSGGGPAAAPSQAAFDSAGKALAAGNSSEAAALFARARDLDVVRFRAPGEFNSIIRRLAATHSAHYVPVSELFERNAQYGIPGNDLILEHVHPNSHGYALLAQAFVDAIRGSRTFPRADFQRLRPLSEYEARMRLTPFDSQIALHEVRTVTTRWPFVPFDQQQDYRGTYKPVDKIDSLAFMVSRGGINWAAAKSELAAYFEANGRTDEAVLEYEGLSRNFPQSERPLSLAARALLSANKAERAAPYLERAVAIAPTGYTTFALGVITLRRKETARAIQLLQTSLRITPRNPDAMYQLSLAYALSGDAGLARSTALQLLQVAPEYPGLTEWIGTLGIRPE